MVFDLVSVRWQVSNRSSGAICTTAYGEGTPPFPRDKNRAEWILRIKLVNSGPLRSLLGGSENKAWRLNKERKKKKEKKKRKENSKKELTPFEANLEANRGELLLLLFDGEPKFVPVAVNCDQFFRDCVAAKKVVLRAL